MNKLALLVGSSLIAGMTIAADQESAITQSTDLELTVPSGETWTYDKTITLTDGAKLVKKGVGTLVLSAGDNSFDGGVELQQGFLRADAEGALGSKKIVLSSTSSRRLVFNAEGATFSNDIEQTAAGHYEWNTSLIEVKKTTRLTGDVLSPDGNLCLAALTAGATLEVDGTVDMGERNLEFDNATKITFNGSIICNELHSGRGWDSKGAVYIKNTSNAIRRICQDGSIIYQTVAGSLDGVEIVQVRRQSGGIVSGIQLGGINLTVPYVDDTLTTKTDVMADEWGGYIRSSSESTLTVTGGVSYAGDDTARCRYYIGYSGEKINLVLDAPNFTQIFMERGLPGAYPNNTAGTIGVSNGTFRVTDKVQFPKVPLITVAAGGTLSSAMTSGIAFGSCTSLRLNGKLRVDEGTLFPFKEGDLAIDASSGAEIWLPADMVIYPVSLTIDGKPAGAGVYASGIVKSGKIVISGSSATWTGGGGEDTSIATPANWGGSTPDIYYGASELQFASGGSVASIGEACVFGSTTLSAANGFTFGKDAPSATIGISGHLSIEKNVPSDTVREFAFEPPVELRETAASQAQTFDVPANDTLSFEGGLSLPGSGATLTKTGAGTLSLGDGSVIEGGIRHNEGEIRISGLLGTPGHVDQGEGHIPQWSPLSFYMDATTGKGQTLVLDGATIEKPMFGKRASPLFTTVNNTVNVFKGHVHIQDPETTLPANGPEGEIWFKGGLRCSWAVIPSGGGSVHIGDYVTETFARTNVIWMLECGGSTRVVFEGTRNQVTEGVYFPFENAILEFNESHAFVTPLPLLYFGNQYASGGAPTNTFNLGSTVQQVVKIGHNASEPTRREVITGAVGSVLEVTGGADAESDSVVSWAGGVSLLKSGASRMTMRYQASPTTGDITVTAGELVFADGASWRNGANVTVSGTGKLTVTQPDTFGRGIALALNDDGVLSVAEGATIRTETLTVNGVKVTPGRYTYASAPAVLKAHLDPAAGGAVTVKGGLVLMVR